MDKFLARFFIEESSSAVNQEEWACRSSYLAALRTLALGENLTVFFIFAMLRFLQGCPDESVSGGGE
eukprot:scaffold28264_cov117-Skeletonema_marinoi.AAC.4